MNDLNMGNSLYPDNFVEDRQQREFEKYGRLPGRSVREFNPPDGRHSIEPAYGNYDRPINESV